jgi:hypothetical protein
MTSIMRTTRQPTGMGVVADTYYAGEVLKASATPGRLAKSALAGDLIYAVVDADSVNVRGFSAAVPAGKKISCWRLGCQEVVEVRSIPSQTYNPGDGIYASATAGAVTPTPNTSRPIGHYPEWMAATVVGATGDMRVPCVLDVAPGTATVAGS